MSDTPQVLLAHHLKALKLPTFLREYDRQARVCAAEGIDYPRYLLRLAEQELIDRDRRMVDRRIKAAKFPAVKTLDSFDFEALPSLNKALVMELARSEYVERRDNIIALGNSGTGKSHVAIGLGLAACQRGLSVGFTAASTVRMPAMLVGASMSAPSPPMSVLTQPGWKLMTVALPASAIDTQAAFPDPVLQSRYEHLTNELRCLVCQNQTIADSNASLAGDLRREVREMIARGDSDRDMASVIERLRTSRS